jgi:KaiC/GvpD/RAD55 family RecA-like ATPase
MDLSHSENIILRYVISSQTYLETCKREFFKNESFGEILAAVREFWDKYHEIPASEQLIEAFKLKGNSDVVDKAEIKSIYEIDLSKYEDEWLKETTEFFIEYKNLTKSAVDALKYIQSTPVTSDNIKTVIDTFKNIIVERNNIDFSFDEGLDFFNPDNHQQLTQNTFSTGYPFIDTVLGGGFSSKALYVFMGMPKVGKSLWLGNLAAQAVRSGHNVAILSLEMTDRKYVKRVGANLLGIPVSTYTEAAEDDQIIKKKLGSMAYDNLRVPGHLMIKEFPTSQASVNDIERYLRKVEENKGIKFKVVIVDYINIMKNWRNANSENTYMKIKQIAEDLRGMAMNNNWSIVTATQTKQGDFDASDLSINSAAESSGLVATVDGMFGIIQDPIMYANKEYKLKILANRDDGYKNAYKVFSVDYRYMRISEDVNVPMHTE